MRVNFYATLRAPAGGKTVQVKPTGTPTARAVLEMATRNKPELAAEIWQSPGELKEHIHVFINGRQSVFLPQGIDTILGEGDTLDVFPPVGGGAFESI